MACFFNCFRIKKTERGKINERNLSSQSQVVQKPKEDRSPFQQIETEKLHDSASNEGINNEIKNEINDQKPVSKNQLSAAFLREDLEDENSPVINEDKETMEISSTESPQKEDNNKDSPDNKEESTPVTPEQNNSFIDKHILQQNPNNINNNDSPFKTPISTQDPVPLVPSPNTKTGTENELPGLSDWLKPVNKDIKDKRYDALMSKTPSGVSSDSERPIIGSVFAHWNEDSESDSVQPVKPKPWDGKGIPNSTHKYKEDQKVSYHATPFEVMIEKALSQDTFLSQRGLSDGIKFELEGEESDTAAS